MRIKQSIKCFFGFHWPVQQWPIFNHEGELSHVNRRCVWCGTSWQTWTDRSGQKHVESPAPEGEMR